MAIDDKLEKLADQLTSESELTFQTDALNAFIAGLPFMGGAVSSLIAGQAKRRLVKRIMNLFEEVKRRLDKIDEAAIDERFFDTEEFQTILALALQQLQTTYDEHKIRMIACALANSGTKEYASEMRKEIFIGALRELTSDHVVILSRLRTAFQVDGRTVYRNEKVCDLEGVKLLVMQNLVSRGFVEESAKRRNLEHRHTGSYPEELAIKLEELARKVLEEVPERCFEITKLGEDFLKFIGESSSET